MPHNNIVVEFALENVKDEESRQVILESLKNDANEIQSDIITLYKHLIKFVYQPQRQDKSWYNTIYDTHIKISDGLASNNYRNLINKINLDSCYEEARKRAIKEAHLDQRLIPKERPYEWDLNFTTNLDLIVDFLKTNYNPNATYNIKDIDEFIREKENKNIPHKK